MGFGKKLGKSEKGFIVIALKKVLNPPAWAYVDTVGKIYGMEVGAYANR